MRRVLLSIFFIFTVPAFAWANVPIDKISFQPQVKGVGCLKPETLAMLGELVAKIGAIEITSTCGGRHARRSHHYGGKAVDFRPLATSTRAAVVAAKALESTGGVGSYPGGLVHVDVGDREFSWYGHKRSRRHYSVAANGRR